MGFRFRKSVKLGKHVKINFNKNSVSTTFGTKGMHYTVNSNGKRTKTVSIPGTGLYYTETNNGNNKKSNTVNNKSTAMNTQNNDYQEPQNNKCKHCGGTIDNRTKKCTNCGKSNNASNLSVILWLIFFCPVGLYLMLKKTDWHKTLKIILSAVYGCWIAFCIFFLAVGIFYDSPSEETTSTSASTSSYIQTTTDATSSVETTEEKTTTTTTTETTSNTTKASTIAASTTKATNTTKNTTTETTREQTAKRTTTETTVEKKSGITVYITPTGKKYHYSKSCAGKNAMERDLNDVQGIYGPCKKCAQ